MLAHNNTAAGCVRRYTMKASVCRRDGASLRVDAPAHRRGLRTKPTANDSSNFRKLLWDTRRGIQGTVRQSLPQLEMLFPSSSLLIFFLRGLFCSSWPTLAAASLFPAKFRFACPSCFNFLLLLFQSILKILWS